MKPIVVNALHLLLVAGAVLAIASGEAVAQKGFRELERDGRTIRARYVTKTKLRTGSVLVLETHREIGVSTGTGTSPGVPGICFRI